MKYTSRGGNELIKKMIIEQIMNIKDWLTKSLRKVLISKNIVFLSIKRLILTILVILMTICLSDWSFKYNLSLHKISQYYSVLAFPLLLINIISVLIVILISKYPKIARLFMAIQETTLFLLLYLFFAGFFRN